MKRVPKRIGWAVQSDRGWFFWAIGTESYRWHVALGRLDVSWDWGRGKRPR